MSTGARKNAADKCKVTANAHGFRIAPRADQQPQTKRPTRLGEPFVYGAANRIRTDDLVITNDVLYRLSYSSVVF